MPRRPGAFPRPAVAIGLLLAGCAAAPPERLPAELVRDGLLFVRGTIAGHEATMLLDTGAGATLIGAGFAERIGLPTHEGSEATAVGIGGRAEARRIDGVALTLGRVGTTVPAVVLPLEFAAVLGRDLEVVLGRDVFTAFVVELDYATGTVAFHDRESFRYRGDGTTLRLQKGELGAWYVAGSIEDLGTAWLELDTGDSGTLTLHAPFARRHSLLDGRPRGTALIGGVGGVIEVAATRIDRLSLGGADFHDVPVDVDDVAEGMFQRTRADGNLGTALLSRFKVFVDGWRGQIHLEPIADRVAAPFPRNRSGLALAHRGSHLEVLHVAAESPAAAAGMRVGDRIRTVDGIDVAKDYWSRTWQWVRQPAGTPVSLELVDGTRRGFALGDVP